MVVSDVIDVVLPVLDEAEALPWVLARFPEGYAPIVVDNGSTDGSAEIAEELGARVIPEPVPGFGSACFAGLLATRTEIVCFMDADGSLDPRDLPAVADPVARRSADLVLGARVPVASALSTSARLANGLIAWELRRRTRYRLSDLGPMRAARTQALIDLAISDRRFGWPLEMVLLASRRQWRVEERPVAYHPRRGGRSKVSGNFLGAARTVRDMAGVLR